MNGQPLPYDDNGHGTHVAGIDCRQRLRLRRRKVGHRAEASIISLKVLDADGTGTISSIIAALNWVAANATTYNIKVVNMSVGASVYESCWTDPLTLAAKARDRQGHHRRRGGRQPREEPRRPPAVRRHHRSRQRAVGADRRRVEHDGHADPQPTTRWLTSARRGPSAIDFEAKPDLVAPGTGTVSLAAPGSTFYTKKSAFLLSGKRWTANKPYLTLSGTSMAAPVVSGTGRADAAGESEPHAEPGEGDSPIPGAAVLRVQGAPSGRWVPQHARGRRGSRAFTRRRPRAPACPCRASWSQRDHLGQPSAEARRHQADRERVGQERWSGARRRPAARPGQNIVWGVRLRQRLPEHRLGRHRRHEHRLGRRTSSGVSTTT